MDKADVEGAKYRSLNHRNVREAGGLEHALQCRRRGRAPYSTLHQRCSLRALPSVFLQRRLRWFGHASIRATGEHIRKAISSTPSPTWREHRRGQLKTWMRTIQEDLVLLGGPRVNGLRRWNREWLSIGRWRLGVAPLLELHSRVGAISWRSRGVGRLLASVQQSPGAS